MSTHDHRYARPCRRRRPRRQGRRHSRHRHAGRLGGTVAGISAGLLVGGLLAGFPAAPGRAAAVARAAVPAPAAGPAQPAPTHPADDQAGSTIRSREAGPLLFKATGAGGPPGIPGLDVSAHQGEVPWGAVAGAGARFSYVKATEGTTYLNPSFAPQYDGAAAAGLLRGAYHFALPDQSDGVAQANYFVDHGGGRPPKGASLPPALDIEYNPYGDACYGMSPPAMSAWVRDFTRTVSARTRRTPVIYTSTRWWALCTANDPSFGRYPLWLPHYGPTVGDLPAGWQSQAIWQFANSGPFPGDQDVFNGSPDQLRRFAAG